MEKPLPKVLFSPLLSKGLHDYLKEALTLYFPLVLLALLLAFIWMVVDRALWVGKNTYYCILISFSLAGVSLTVRNMIKIERRKALSAFFLSVNLVIAAVSVVHFADSFTNRRAIQKNERRTICNIWDLYSAQGSYRLQNVRKRGIQEYSPSVGVLIRKGFLDGKFRKNELNGYHIYVVSTETDPLFSKWCARADPIEPGKTGRTYFYADQSGKIRGSRSGPAGPRDLIVDE